MSENTPNGDKTDIDEGPSRPGGPDAGATQAFPPDSAPQSQASQRLRHSSGFEAARKLVSGATDTSPTLIRERFLLEDVIGEGGMGRVYRARDLRKVEAEDRNPYVAVKVLTDRFRDHPDAFVTLQQEAVKSQKLAHPNIVTVHDFDRDDNAIYMTMELLKGDPLDQLIRLEAPFSKEVCWRYFKELCAGLEYAHKRGLVHSDFKPGNVFVTTAGVVKILDFGIARAVSGNVLSHDYDVGTLGALTPAYATVEMEEGKPPSFSDDIYALACVFYEMLTGEHPFANRSALKAKAAQLKPRRPEVLEPQEWKALRAALSFDPAQRPPTIDAFRAGVLSLERRNRGWLWVAAAVLLTGAGASLYAVMAYQARQEDTLQELVGSAKNCFIAGDYDCAVENALVVRRLAPDNREVEQLLASARRLQSERERASEVEARVAAARACVRSEDYNCAIENALVARGIAPGNAEVEQLLTGARRAQAEADQQSSLVPLTTAATTCFADADYPCAVENAQLALRMAPGNSAMEQLLADARREQAERDSALEITRLLDEATRCMDGGDYDCATARLRSVLEREDDSPRATALLTQVAGARARERVAVLIDAATRCVDSGDFTCAEAALSEASAAGARPEQLAGAREALATARGRVAARDREAQRLAEERKDRAIMATFLEDAQACFERKDYSCTIAKAESALTVMPTNPAAQAMLEKGQNAQTQVKRAIVIQ